MSAGIKPNSCALGYGINVQGFEEIQPKLKRVQGETWTSVSSVRSNVSFQGNFSPNAKAVQAAILIILNIINAAVR